MNRLCFCRLLDLSQAFFLAYSFFSEIPAIYQQDVPAARLSVSFWGFTEFGLRDADTGLDARVWFDLFSLWHLSLPILLHFSLVFSEKGRYLRNPFVPIALYTPALAFIILDIWQHHVLGLPLKVYWGWTYALKSDALFKLI